MKKRRLLYIPILLALVGCANIIPMGNDDHHTPIDDSDPFIKDDDDGNDVNNDDEEIEIKVDTDDDEKEVIKDETQASKITDLTVDGISYDDTKKLFTITKAGEFIFKGEFEGNILVNADKENDDVKITLNGFTIMSKSDSPIKCDSANELQVSIKKGTQNYIYDYRDTKPETGALDTQGNGAITANCDLKVSGKGSLNIVAKYNNGIHTKDDLKIKNEVFEGSSLQINSYNNCLKGNDSVEIESGNLVLISTNGNGIVSENTDLSDKGNQRGDINITGGQIDIYSAKDAIDAAYNCNITNEVSTPVINIYTSNYSEYSNEVHSVSENKLYLKTSSSIGSSYYFGVEILNADYTTVWKKATAVSSSGSGGYNRSYYYSIDLPSTATSFKVAMFTSSTTSMSEANAYRIMSNYETINSRYDCVSISTRNSTISTSGWTTYATTTYDPGRPGGMGGGMQEGNNEKAEVSAKGIKAANTINISAGTFFIKTYDDAIHANYGDTFENTLLPVGVGDVTITGGTFDLYASDDALHADHNLNIEGGTIEVKSCYEGLEGNTINIKGGYTKVYALDDGVNAANKAGDTPNINVSGGILDVTVYGQDVDGIDSNGNFTQTGGYVITKAGSANSQMCTGLDVDGSATIKGGTFIAFGRTEKTPSYSNGVSNYTLNVSLNVGEHTVTLPDSTSVKVNCKYSYTYVTVYSDNSTKVAVQ